MFAKASEHSKPAIGIRLAPEVETALTGVDQAITRLSRTGIIIQRSSTRRHSAADTLGSREFRETVMSCVQALYSLATAELREYLSERMTARRNEVASRQSNQEKRRIRRALESIPEIEEYAQRQQKILPPGGQQESSMLHGHKDRG